MSKITNEEKKGYFYSTKIGMEILGTLVENPNLILEKKYDFKPEDFDRELHQIIFKAIYNLTMQGATTITPIMIEEYIYKISESWKKILETYTLSGENPLKNITAFSNLSNMDYNYNSIKKLTLMRNLIDFNIEIDDIFDITGKNTKLNEVFYNLKLNDILEIIERKFIKIKRKWRENDEEAYGFKVGEGLRELKEKLKTSPSWGYPFSNQYVNTMVRGMRKGKFLLRSAPTGVGKSRMMMQDTCNLGAKYIYDIDRKKWIRNFNSERVLYISTELEKEEVQTCFLAIISGVNEDKILSATYTTEEEDRIDKGIEILEKSPIYIEVIPDFGIEDIESIIERYIISKNIDFVMFDYLHSTPKLLASITGKLMGMKLNEHQVLFLFSNTLKTLARKYDIFMESSTQLNDGYKDEENLGTSSLRGAKAIGDKIDVGIITTPINLKEKDKVQSIIDSYNKKHSFNKIHGFPTICHTIYKNRGNKYKDIRIWTSMNLGIVKERVLLVTDMYYNLLTIDLFIPEPPVETKEDKAMLKYLNNLNMGTVTNRIKEEEVINF